MSSWYKTSKKRVSQNIPTFHILIATAGRPCLQKMLNSLKDELKENDAITIVFDGKGSIERSGFSNDWLQGHQSHISVIEEEINLGYWGHAIRNRYQEILTPKTDFIMHADDDDVYIPSAFDSLRRSCIHPNLLYIARVFDTLKQIPIPSLIERKIIKNDIATPCGIIPFNKACMARWKYIYGGDFNYYNELQTRVSGVVYLYYEIYTILPPVS